MRNPINFYSFVEELEDKVHSLSENFLRSSVFVYPTFLENFENRILIRTRKIKDLEILILIGWFHPDQEIRPLLILELQQLIEELSEEKEEYSYLRLLSADKTIFLNWLIETKNYSSNEYFGLLNSPYLRRNLPYFASFKMRNKKTPRKPQRKRGYKDKGTLKLAHTKGRNPVLPILHAEIEENRRNVLDTLSFMEGYLE